MTIKPVLIPLIMALPLCLNGCDFLGLNAKPQVQLSAHTSGTSYTGLANTSVAIVIYAPMATLYEYSGAREEISSFVLTQMRGHMPTTRIVDPRDIISWQSETLNWANLSPKDIGRHFNVDRVLAIEVLDYSTKRVTGVSNLQGRLRAQCRIYDSSKTAAGTDDRGQSTPEWMALVDAAWPQGKPLDPTQTNDDAVRLRTLDTFSDLLVQFFYERREPEPSIRG